MDYFEMRWTAPEIIAERRSLLDPSMATLLDLRLQGIEQHPARFGRNDCLPNTAILVLGQSDYAPRLCACSIGRGQYRWSRRRCGLWPLCPYCSHQEDIEHIGKLRHLWDACPRERLWWITLTPDCERLVADFTLFEEAREAQRHVTVWLLKNGVVGAAAVDEFEPFFHFRSEVDALGWPHRHLLAILDVACDVAELRNALLRFPTVAVDLRPIRTRREFKEKIDYPVKSISWARKYDRAWEAVGAGNSAKRAVTLNQAVCEVIREWELFVYGRRKCTPYGILHPRTQPNLVAPSASRKTNAFRDVTRQWLQGVNAECEADVDLDCDTSEL